MKVFVYGTLKSGYGNNRLLSDCKLLGSAILPDHKLYYSFHGGGFPVCTPSRDSTVLGELWEVPQVIEKQVLSSLDRLEGEGTMYNRIEVTIDSPHEESMSKDHKAWTYVGVPKFWFDFKQLTECPNKNGEYIWTR